MDKNKTEDPLKSFQELLESREALTPEQLVEKIINLAKFPLDSPQMIIGGDVLSSLWGARFSLLADRFWVAGLWIYGVGLLSRRGIEWGVIGWTEPWLFVVRHSLELYLKGFYSYVDFIENQVTDPQLPKKLKSEFKHNLIKLYNNYKQKIDKLFNEGKLTDEKEIFILDKQNEKILMEIHLLDKNATFFKYPPELTMSNSWGVYYDDSKIFPTSGLPKEPGIFFDYERVFGSLASLRKELKKIAEFLFIQIELIMEFMREFSPY